MTGNMLVTRPPLCHVDQGIRLLEEIRGVNKGTREEGTQEEEGVPGLPVVQHSEA